MSVQELRQKSGAGIVDCSKALKETSGDVEKAYQLLRQRGLDKAGKFENREANQGTIGVYIHHDGSIGAMVVLSCETDFVARTPEFKQLANDLAMHVVATNPLYLNRKDVPQEELNKELEVVIKTKLKQGMQQQIQEKVISGCMSKFYQDNCFLEQQLASDNSVKVEEAIKLFSSKCGEKVEVKSIKRMTI